MATATTPVIPLVRAVTATPVPAMSAPAQRPIATQELVITVPPHAATLRIVTTAPPSAEATVPLPPIAATTAADALPATARLVPEVSVAEVVAPVEAEEALVAAEAVAQEDNSREDNLCEKS